MVKGTFWQSAALAALVASTAMVAVPAQAQDGRGRWQGRGEASGNASAGREARQDRGGERQAREVRVEQPAPQVQAPAPRSRVDPSWRAQRAGEGGARAARDGNGAGERQARGWNGGQAQAGQARGANEQRSWRGQAPEQARNPQARAVPGRDWSNRGGERQRGYDERARNQGNNATVYRNGNGNQWRDNNRYTGNVRNNYRNDQRGWNNGWRQDRRYDWYSYRNSNRNVYRLGSYYSPYRNYSYRRLSAGLFLDSLFYSQRYWISDPWQYRLPAVDGSYRWVRYYDDVLLIDTYSGEVVDVVYDFFW